MAVWRLRTYAQFAHSDAHVGGIGGLLVRVAPSRREVPAQFLSGATGTVAGGIALNAPPFLQRPGINRIEAERVEQFRHSGLGVAVVAGDDQRATVFRARRLSV